MMLQQLLLQDETCTDETKLSIYCMDSYMRSKLFPVYFFQFPWKLYIHKLYFNVKQKKPITGNEMIAILRLNVMKKIARILKLTPKSYVYNVLFHVHSLMETIMYRLFTYHLCSLIVYSSIIYIVLVIYHLQFIHLSSIVYSSIIYNL